MLLARPVPYARGMGGEMRPAIAAAALVMLAGCSVMLMERQDLKTWRPPQPLHCSEGRGFAAWDFLLGTIDAVAAGYYVSLAQNDGFDDELRNQAFGYGVAAAALSLVHLTSGAIGMGAARDCSEARSRERRHVEVERIRRSTPLAPTREQLETERLRREVEELKRQRAAEPTQPPADMPPPVDPFAPPAQ